MFLVLGPGLSFSNDVVAPPLLKPTFFFLNCNDSKEKKKGSLALILTGREDGDSR